MKPSFGWNVSTSLFKAQGYGHKWKDCWVPKSSYGQSSQMQPTLGQHQIPQPNLHNKRRMVYKWVPKPQPSSSASSKDVTKPVEAQTKDPKLCKEPKPVEPKLQVWRPKPLNRKRLPQLTKLPEIQASAISNGSNKKTPKPRQATLLFFGDRDCCKTCFNIS